MKNIIRVSDWESLWNNWSIMAITEKRNMIYIRSHAPAIALAVGLQTVTTVWKQQQTCF